MGLGNSGSWSSGGRPSGLGTAPVVTASAGVDIASAVDIAGLLLGAGAGAGVGTGGRRDMSDEDSGNPNPNSLLAVAAASHAARPMTQVQHQHRQRQLQHQAPVTIAGRAMRGNRKKSGDFVKVMQYEGMDARNFTGKAPPTVGDAVGAVGNTHSASSAIPLQKNKSPASAASQPQQYQQQYPHHHQPQRRDKPFAQHHYQQQQQQYQMQQMQYQRQPQPQQSKASKAVVLAEIEVDRSPMLIAAAAKAALEAKDAAEEALEAAIDARTAADAKRREKEAGPAAAAAAKVAAAAAPKREGRVRKLSTKMAASVSYKAQEKGPSKFEKAAVTAERKAEFLAKRASAAEKKHQQEIKKAADANTKLKNKRAKEAAERAAAREAAREGGTNAVTAMNPVIPEGPIIPDGQMMTNIPGAGVNTGGGDVDAAVAPAVVRAFPKLVLKLDSNKAKKVAASLNVVGVGGKGRSGRAGAGSTYSSSGGGGRVSAVDQIGNDGAGRAAAKKRGDIVSDSDEGGDQQHSRASRPRRIGATKEEVARASERANVFAGVSASEKGVRVGTTETSVNLSSSSVAAGNDNRAAAATAASAAAAAVGRKDSGGGGGGGGESRKRARKDGPKDAQKTKAGAPGSNSSPEAVAAAADIAAAAALATALAPVPRSRGGAHGRHGRSYMPKNNGAITLVHTKRHFDTGARYPGGELGTFKDVGKPEVLTPQVRVVCRLTENGLPVPLEESLFTDAPVYRRGGKKNEDMSNEHFDKRHRPSETAEKKTKLWGTAGTRFELQQELRRLEEQRKEEEATLKARKKAQPEEEEQEERELGPYTFWPVLTPQPLPPILLFFLPPLSPRPRTYVQT